jgi:hypothetical protein
LLWKAVAGDALQCLFAITLAQAVPAVLSKDRLVHNVSFSPIFISKFMVIVLEVKWKVTIQSPTIV